MLRPDALNHVFPFPHCFVMSHSCLIACETDMQGETLQSLKQSLTSLTELLNLNTGAHVPLVYARACHLLRMVEASQNNS